MQRYRQFQPLLIEDFEVTEWAHPAHRHNHYEVIYISHGEGRHIINDVAMPYSQGDVFLLGPEEAHYFEVKQCTRFIYVKFTDPYLYGKEDARQLEYLVKSRETHLSGFPLTALDRHTLSLIFETIIALREDEQLVWLQLLTVAGILQRNMPELKITDVGSGNARTRDIQAIYCYLHKHIYDPGKLRAATMAAHFNMSEEYLGPYFKRHTGNTLREYIGSYRRHLIQQRVESGVYTLKEIAAAFGLTDESHVTKLLKRSQ
jgi:AraC family transcriptional regulator, L-rhamnose operon regulatory protein RhaS